MTHPAPTARPRDLSTAHGDPAEGWPMTAPDDATRLWTTTRPTEAQHEALRRIGGRWLVSAWGYPRWAVQVVDHTDDAVFAPDRWVALSHEGVPIPLPGL